MSFHIITNDEGKLTISKSEPQSVKDLIDSSYIAFQSVLTLLESFNEIVPQSIKEYTKIAFKEQQREFEKLDEEGRKEYEKFNENLKKLIEGRISSFEVSHNGVIESVAKELETVKVSSRFPTFLGEMSLVYLVSMFEEFLKSTLRNIFMEKAESLKSMKKSISYEEIFDCKNMQELKDRVIDKEIDAIINEGIEEIEDYLKERFDLELGKNNDWKAFKERFYRRNIVIHNNAFPNEKYREKTGYDGEQVRLSIDREYLTKSIELFRIYSKIIRDSFVSKFA